jgi:adenylate cyclase
MNLTIRPVAVRSLGMVLRELKRRHVPRVAFAYCTVSWIILEVAATVFPPLRIPDWSLSLVVVLLGIGLPVTLVLAWAYDITPRGVERTLPEVQPVDHPCECAEPRGTASEVAVEPAVRSSIVVLPFLDRGPGGVHQFLGDGIAEELINGLAGVAGLRVVARTSSFLFRGDTVDAREIGAKLGVGLLIEGGLRVTETRLRLTVQMVDARNGYAVWSRVFERQAGDLLQLQEEVAQTIVDSLRTGLSGEGSPVPPRHDRLLRSSTSDVEAYTHYLRGRALWNERTPASLRDAIRHFERALEQDPAYAHAHAGVADSFAILLDYGIVAPADGLPPAREAAARASELGAGLAEAQTSAALVRQMEGDWEAAEAGFRRALDLNAGYVIARQRLALLLAWTGRIEESRREIGLAHRLDPLSPIIAASRGWIEYYAGEYNSAIRILKPVVAGNPRLSAGRAPLALSWLQVGSGSDAAAVMGEGLVADQQGSAEIALYCYSLARGGREDEARQQLDVLLEMRAHRYVSPYYLAVAYLGLGEHPSALQQLARAVAENAPQALYLAAEPIFHPLRDDPGFVGLLGEIRLAGAR